MSYSFYATPTNVLRNSVDSPFYERRHLKTDRWEVLNPPDDKFIVENSYRLADEATADKIHRYYKETLVKPSYINSLADNNASFIKNSKSYYHTSATLCSVATLYPAFTKTFLSAIRALPK